MQLGKGSIKLILVVDIFLKWWLLRRGEVVFNEGIFLGLPLVWPKFLVGIGILILVYWWSRAERIGERLVIIGGLSNLADRLVYGAVVDYIKLPYFNLWVNLGDLAITFGLVLILKEALYDMKNGDNLRGPGSISDKQTSGSSGEPS